MVMEKRTDMNATLSMESLWQMLSTLSAENRRWLSERLLESLEEERVEFISKEDLLAGVDSGLKYVVADRKLSFDEFIKEDAL